MQLLTKALAVVLMFSAGVSASLAASPATVFEDRDWRDPAAVTRSEGVERDMGPALLLKTEFKEPVFLFDPTEDETITAITDFQGKLYLGSCTRPSITNTGSVFTYDPKTNQWEKAFQVNEQGLIHLAVYGDRLYIPGYDAEDGGWDLGNIYIHDGDTWVEHRTVPRAIHIYGLAVYKDRIYISGDIFSEPPPGVSVEEACEQGLPMSIYGRVMSSGDGGLTWREEYRGPREGQDVGLMTVFDDRLVLNAHGDLVLFGGSSWERLGLNPNALCVLDYCDAGGRLLLGTSVGLCVLDGDEFRRLDAFSGEQWIHVRAIDRFGPRWAVVITRIFGGTFGHGPGGTGYLPLKGNEQPFSCWLELIPDLVFRAGLLGDADACREIKEHAPVEWGTTISCEEMIVSAHVLQGRLFLGTHPEGRVLVLPVVREGTLDSAPRAIAAGGAYTLSWEAATPPGTNCRLQVRSATTREALEKEPFVGPDGSESSFFDASGSTVEIAEPGFVQYRVLLKTDDPALTPYVKRVALHQGA